MIDFSKAYPKAHNYTVEKLKEKFGPKGHCTMLDYAKFYVEGLELFGEAKEAKGK